MFSTVNLEKEVARVKGIWLPLPHGFGLTITDEDLCKLYLYHLISGNVGVFNETPILHLHHNNLPLVNQLWEPDLDTLFHINQCLYIVTDGEFKFPTDEWTGSGRRCGPIFSDHLLQFHCTRYRFKSMFKDLRFILDLFTASPVKGVVVPPAYNFNYRIMRLHNPEIYNYRGHHGRRAKSNATGPYGPPPSPFLGP